MYHDRGNAERRKCTKRTQCGLLSHCLSSVREEGIDQNNLVVPSHSLVELLKNNNCLSQSAMQLHLFVMYGHFPSCTRLSPGHFLKATCHSPVTRGVQQCPLVHPLRTCLVQCHHFTSFHGRAFLHAAIEHNYYH